MQYYIIFVVLINRSTLSNWHIRSNRINITCILLIPTTSDRWMKAFRNMPYPRTGPNSEEIYLSLKDDFFVSPPQWLLPHPECWPIYNLYNDALYKIEKLSFTKDSLEKKEKKYQIFGVLKRKTLSRMIFLNHTLMLNCFFLITQQVYMHLQHLETLNICTSVTLDTA